MNCAYSVANKTLAVDHGETTGKVQTKINSVHYAGIIHITNNNNPVTNFLNKFNAQMSMPT